MTPKEEKQFMFDKALKAVVKQGCAAYEGSTCVYLADDGRRCAVGHLLTGKTLKWAKGNNGAVFDLLYNAKEDKVELPKEIRAARNSGFLGDLQGAHDEPHKLQGREYVNEFLINMTTIAKEYKLNTKVLDRLRNKYDSESVVTPNN